MPLGVEWLLDSRRQFASDLHVNLIIALKVASRDLQLLYKTSLAVQESLRFPWFPVGFGALERVQERRHSGGWQPERPNEFL